MTFFSRVRSLWMGLTLCTAGAAVAVLTFDQKATIARDSRHFREILGSVIPQGTEGAAFKVQRFEKPAADGGTEIENRYLDSRGEVALLELARIGPNTEVLSYRFEQRQTGDRGGVERIQGKEKAEIRLSFSKKGKPTEVQQEDAPTNLVVGPSLIPYLFKHREELLDGKEIVIRLAVPERLDTYGFSIRHRGRAELNGREVIRVEMRPTSLIIRQVLDPMSFYMDLEARQLLGYSGRMPVFLRASPTSSWDAFQGLTIYQPDLGGQAVIQARSPGGQ